MRSARTSRMSALVWDSSVTIPAWEPVREIARWPRSLITIAHSAQEMRSPEDSSMSISRGSGASETSSAIAISSSVVFPRADSTATTRAPRSRFSTIRLAARLMRSASATEVPPNFITTTSGMCAGRSRAFAQNSRALTARRPAKALPSVTSSAYSRSEPTGRPLARRVTASPGARTRSSSAMCSAVASPVVVGLVASTTSLTAPS